MNTCRACLGKADIKIYVFHQINKKNKYFHMHNIHIQTSTNSRRASIILYLHYAIYRIWTTVATGSDQSRKHMQKDMVAKFFIYS